jgi:hypothetical protein
MGELDATDFALGAVISQKRTDDKLQPIAYHSCTFSPTKIHYKIHNIELLAMLNSLKIWSKYLEGAQFPVLSYNNPQRLEYYTTTKVLNR